MFPALASTIRLLQDAGAGAVHLSGAGPTLVAVCETDAGAGDLVAEARLRGVDARPAHTVDAAASTAVTLG